MAAQAFKERLENLDLLLSAKNLFPAARIAWLIVAKIRGFEDWVALQNVLQRHLNDLYSHPDFARIYARALIGSGQPADVIRSFIESVVALHSVEIVAALEIELSLLDLRQQQPQAALNRLTKAIPYLMGRDLGLAYSRLGQAKAKLQHTDFPEAFQQMRQHLTGRDLGMQVLQEGNIWYFRNPENAKSCYIEAAQLFQKDTVNRAHTESNLGLLLLLECNPAAHTHLENAEKRTRHKRYAAHHTELSKSLAASHRSRGDFDTALRLYKRALDRTTRPDLKLEVTINIARTQRLAYRYTAARETLTKAFAFAEQERLNPSVAQLERLALDLKTDHTCLDQTFAALSDLSSADLEFEALLNAEYARQKGQDFMLYLEKVPTNRRLAREEAPHWQDLWRAAEQSGWQAPKPLILRNRRVEIEPQLVRVDGIERTLSPNSRTLLEHFLKAKGRIEKAILEQEWYPNHSTTAIKSIFRVFRQDMGWHDSLIVAQGWCTLDRRAKWGNLSPTDSGLLPKK